MTASLKLLPSPLLSYQGEPQSSVLYPRAYNVAQTSQSDVSQQLLQACPENLCERVACT